MAAKWRKRVRAGLPFCIAVALMAGGGARPASAASPCLEASEKAAFDIRALQSQLMVVALTCGQQDEYNVFVRRHQAVLLGAYQQLTWHFGRLHGPDGEARRDRYITELANVHSMGAIRQGSSFCGGGRLLFQLALAVQEPDGVVLVSSLASAPDSYAPAACARLDALQ